MATNKDDFMGLEDWRWAGYSLESAGYSIPKTLALIAVEHPRLEEWAYSQLLDGWADGRIDWERWTEDMETGGDRGEVHSEDEIPW